MNKLFLFLPVLALTMLLAGLVGVQETLAACPIGIEHSPEIQSFNSATLNGSQNTLTLNATVKLGAICDQGGDQFEFDGNVSYTVLSQNLGSTVNHYENIGGPGTLIDTNTINVSSLGNGTYTVLAYISSAWGNPPDDSLTKTFTIDNRSTQSPAVDLKVRIKNVGSYVDGIIQVESTDQIQLKWSVSGSPASCTASGAWSGSKVSSNGDHIETRGPLSEGEYTYTINCDGDSDSVIVTSNDDSGNDAWPVGDHNNTNNSSCSVAGWSADSDNLSTDLSVRVYADDGSGRVLVDTVTASGYSSGLTGVCTGGTCAWTANLTDNANITEGVSYDITAEAQSVNASGVPVGVWASLGETAGDLTCPVGTPSSAPTCDLTVRKTGTTPYTEGPLAVSNGNNIDLTWSTTDADSCTWEDSLSTYSDPATSGTWLGVFSPGGLFGPTTKIGTISCSNSVGSCSDTVVVNVAGPLSCTPSSQGVQVGQTASFGSSGGSGTYAWTASGGTPSSGSNASFSTTYSVSGTKTVTITRGTESSSCSVTVTDSAPPLACSPTSQNVDIGSSASLSASGGSGMYAWTASGGTPSSGSNASFSTTYSSSGVKTITVNDGSEAESCSVTVLDSGNDLPIGYHDSNNNSTCRVVGWSADPDSLEEDLSIRLTLSYSPSSKGKSSETANIQVFGTAGNFRADLLDAGVCVDGKCGFDTFVGDAAGFVYEREYSVTAAAQDAQTGAWEALSQTPKSITCDEPSATGSIEVHSNIPTTWTITGPGEQVPQPALQNEIESATYTDVPVGTYTLTPAVQVGYNGASVDIASTQTVTASGTTVFNINYWTPSLVVTDDPQEIGVGQIAQFGAEYDSDGAGPAVSVDVTTEAGWNVDDEFIATNLNLGTFRGVSNGTTRVAANYGGRIAFGNLTVSDTGGGADPFVSLSALPLQVAPGEDALLEWTSGNVTACIASDGDWRGEYSKKDQLPFNTTAQTTITNITENMTFSIQCEGDRGMVSDTVGIQVVPPGFLLNVAPDVSIGTTAGSESGPTVVTVIPRSGFSGDVTLYADGSPLLGLTDVDFVFDDTVLTESGYSTQLRVTSNVDLEPGPYTITVTGTSPSFSSKIDSFILYVGGIGAGGTIIPIFEEF